MRKVWLWLCVAVVTLALGGCGHTDEEMAAKKREVDKLSADQRTAVVLRYYANLTEVQMAAVLDVAPGTVKSRLSRALSTLAADPDLADHEGLT